MREASQSLQIRMERGCCCIRMFDRRVMSGYPQMVDMLNGCWRRRRPAQPDLRADPRPADVAGATGEPRPRRQERLALNARRRRRRPAAPRTHTAWLGQADRSAEPTKAPRFDLLQQLLSGRRELIGKLRPERRQTENARAAGDHRSRRTRSATCAARGQQRQRIAQPARHQADAARADAASSAATRARLSRRTTTPSNCWTCCTPRSSAKCAATRPPRRCCASCRCRCCASRCRTARSSCAQQHPARQLLNAVAESGARWLDDDDIDPQLLPPLQQAVDHVVENFDGDTAVFEASNRDLQAQLQHLARKAEMAERRHVEAARGKEKLEIAKRQAAETIARRSSANSACRKFVRALLNQAWADVLTLTLLRQGEDSADWQQQLEMTRASSPPAAAAAARSDPAWPRTIEAALGQVGYHAEEAAAIARRLTSALEDDEDDPASRTELTMRLKARVRLGEDDRGDASRNCRRATPRSRRSYDQLRVMPYGTWIEFITNQQGDVVRRRLSWYSPMTDKALFVNQRGQRVGEQSLDSVARMLARGQARIVVAERGRLVDRAWQATLNALRSFAGRGARKRRRCDQAATEAAVIDEFRRARRRKVPRHHPGHRRHDRQRGRPHRQPVRNRHVADRQRAAGRGCAVPVPLPPARRARARQLLEVGAHLLWLDRASAPGQAWTGLPLHHDAGKPDAAIAAVAGRPWRGLRINPGRRETGPSGHVCGLLQNRPPANRPRQNRPGRFAAKCG